MLKLEVLLTVYNKGFDLLTVCQNDKRHWLRLSEMHFCGCRPVVCLSPPCGEMQHCSHAVWLTLANCAWNHVVWSCLAKMWKCSWEKNVNLLLHVIFGYLTHCNLLDRLYDEMLWLCMYVRNVRWLVSLSQWFVLFLLLHGFM